MSAGKAKRVNTSNDAGALAMSPNVRGAKTTRKATRRRASDATETTDDDDGDDATPRRCIGSPENGYLLSSPINRH